MLLQKHNDSSQNPLLVQATNNAILRRLEREAADPVLLAERAGFVLDAWQVDLLRSDAAQMILNCSRQAGKSTVSSILALHTALYQKQSLVLLLSPSLRQSQELFRKVKDCYQAVQNNFLPTAREESALRLAFDNDSRIVALPGTEATVRGFSGVNLLIADEASRCEDALYHGIRPMLAVSRGRIILPSTPFGKRGFFHDVWTNRDAAWKRVEITAYDVPRIDKDWLAEERRSIPDFIFRQEYLCEFVETLDSVFSYDDIQAALDSDIKPLFPKE